VDILGTDYPYGMSYVAGHRKVQFEAIAGDDKADYETLAKLIALADVAAYTFCRWDNLLEFPPTAYTKTSFYSTPSQTLTSYLIISVDVLVQLN
jgi:hypothetical protein